MCTYRDYCIKCMCTSRDYCIKCMCTSRDYCIKCMCTSKSTRCQKINYYILKLIFIQSWPWPRQFLKRGSVVRSNSIIVYIYTRRHLLLKQWRSLHIYLGHLKIKKREQSCGLIQYLYTVKSQLFKVTLVTKAVTIFPYLPRPS